MVWRVGAGEDLQLSLTVTRQTWDAHAKSSNSTYDHLLHIQEKDLLFPLSGPSPVLVNLHPPAANNSLYGRQPMV